MLFGSLGLKEGVGAWDVLSQLAVGVEAWKERDCEGGAGVARVGRRSEMARK